MINGLIGGDEAMAYPTDLTDSQWELIKEFFDTGNDGKSRKHSRTEVGRQ